MSLSSQLNNYLWPRLLDPGYERLNYVFHGSGATLGENVIGKDGIVFGASLRGYGPLPNVTINWKVYFLGNLNSTRLLGGYSAITDPGLLLQDVVGDAGDTIYDFSFLPDESMPELKRDLTQAGIHLIDPNEGMSRVIQDVQESEVVLVGSVTGAIIADALGTSWISIRHDPKQDFFWKGWCGSYDMMWSPIDAQLYSLDWAKRYAVPQRTATSIRERHLDALHEQLDRFNTDISTGNL